MFKLFHSTLKNHVSEIDQFLAEFDKKPEAHSVARKKEEEKAASIAAKRDDKEAPRQESEIWKDF